MISIFLVYAIEASDMATQARLVVAKNKMEDRITVIHSRVEVNTINKSTPMACILSILNK